MTQNSRRRGIGKRIAPPRFIVFVALFAVLLAVCIPLTGLGRGTMLAFDGATLVFLAALVPLLRHGEAERMRAAADENDANRTVLLAFSAVTLVVILVSVAKELQGKNDARSVVIVIATLMLAWIFSNTIYALHYAHLYYSDDDAGKDQRGLTFPDCDEPDYWDFVYFSFTLGMTFQTSDVELTSRRIRRVAIGQCLAAFVFNLGVVAFTINVLGGGGS